MSKLLNLLLSQRHVLRLREIFANFLNQRSEQEKKVVLVFLVCAVLIVDYLLVVNPLVRAFTVTLPELHAVKTEYKTLREDEKNKATIQRQWELKLERSRRVESGLIAQGELPKLLEGLSKLASHSDVKIISLKPTGDPKKSIGPYSRIPIQLSAMAGTHDFGRFLEQLENGKTIFKVKTFTMASNPSDIRRHAIAMELEAYRKR